MKAGKCWGTTRAIFGRNNVEVHVIGVNAGGKCSKHRHQHKANAFYVLEGRLAIDVWKRAYDLVDRTVLEAGEYMEVGPGEFHRFEALTDVTALEVYYVTLDPDDIERETVGSA